MKNLPKRWFFFDPSLEKKIPLLYNINNIGIIFYKKRISTDNTFFRSLKTYVEFCRNNKIFFLVSYSLYWARKYKANGIYISIFNKDNSLNTRLCLKKIKNFLVATSVHNVKEMNLSYKYKLNFLFVSPAFRTNSHKELEEHGRIRFINLCKYSNTKVFALGGVNEVNFKLLKNKYVSGFGGITNFLV